MNATIGSLSLVGSYEEIVFPTRCISHESEQGGQKGYWTAFPITFPDGHHGRLVVVKGMKRPKWQPSDDIARIIVEYKNHDR